MGWKGSLIIVQHPEPAIPEAKLLETLGFKNVTPSGATTLDQCFYPNDKSLNIGSYNDCLLITDDYRLTSALDKPKFPDQLAEYERVLTTLYPRSEILSVACHSVVNYHMYSLVKGGKKLRYKSISGDDPLCEYGDRLPEEEAIYSEYSTTIDTEDELTEDQLMEEFTFGVASRLLGVRISFDDDELLMNETVFNKYRPKKQSLLAKLFG